VDVCDKKVDEELLSDSLELELWLDVELVLLFTVLDVSLNSEEDNDVDCVLNNNSVDELVLDELDSVELDVVNASVDVELLELVDADDVDSASVEDELSGKLELEDEISSSVLLVVFELIDDEEVVSTIEEDVELLEVTPLTSVLDDVLTVEELDCEEKKPAYPPSQFQS